MHSEVGLAPGLSGSDGVAEGEGLVAPASGVALGEHEFLVDRFGVKQIRRQLVELRSISPKQLLYGLYGMAV